MPEERALDDSYAAARAGCVLIDRSAVARVWVTGRDRLDLLDRMSTNDLREMAENEGRTTVLTNAHGRIVDYLLVLHLGERALLLGSAGEADALRRWLVGHIFFQDEVQLDVAGDELGQFGLFGTQAAEVAAALMPGAVELPHNHALPLAAGWLIRVTPLSGGGFEIVAPRARLDELAAQAAAAGAVLAPTALYELLRIEAGRPGAGHEISQEYIPLEVGLWDAVSFSKGCYIGQEIIARMESRGRLAKTLVGLRAADEPPINATLRAADGSRGVVTSRAWSPRLGWIGLGLIKPSAAIPGAPVTISHNGQAIAATIAALPFAD